MPHRTITLAFLSPSLFSLLATAGEVIQLPTGAFTTVNTTVSVPDGGTVSLGGISRLREGRTERGIPVLGKVPYLNRLFKNVGIGRETQSLNMSVTPRIIILEEEEERQVGRVLADRARAGGPRPPDLTNMLYERRAAFLRRHVAENAPRPFDEPVAALQEDPFAQVEALRRENEIAQENRDREAVIYFEKGRSAEEEGKTGAAKVYYNMAMKRAKGELKDEILTRLEAVGGN